MKELKPNFLREKAGDQIERADRIARWPEMIEEMKARTGLTVHEWCVRCNVNETHLNHVMAGRRGASWTTIYDVEDAIERAITFAIEKQKQPVDK